MTEPSIERARDEAEQARVAAEQARDVAEQARQAAEGAREAAERTREAGEQLREIGEELRVSAEHLREESGRSAQRLEQLVTAGERVIARLEGAMTHAELRERSSGDETRQVREVAGALHRDVDALRAALHEELQIAQQLLETTRDELRRMQEMIATRHPDAREA